MFEHVAATAADQTFHIGLIVTALGFGFRHGIDWDHIAALTDITSSQQHPRRSMFFATLYALGHALVVFTLGFAAIVLAARLPGAIDAGMERVVGFTLVVLACYVFYALARQREEFRLRSRWMLVFAGVRAGRRWLRRRVRGGEIVAVEHEHAHEHAHDHAHAHDHDLVPVASGTAHATVPRPQHRHAHRHIGVMPDDPFADYAPRTAFGIGMIHGVGAETPTQLLIFVTAAGAGGKGVGLLLLAGFVAGLLASNTLIALAGTFGFLGAARNFKLYAIVSLFTATFSLAIGLLFLFGSASTLPAIFGG